MTIGERILSVLSVDPAANAVKFDGRWTSWGALHEQADAIDRVLRSVGIDAGAQVGLVLRNHPRMIAGLLAILSARRCVVVLSPHHGDARLAEDIREIAPAAVIALAQDWQRVGFAQAVTAAGSLGLQLSDDGAVARMTSSTVAAHAKDGSADVAVLMLTSGTTGAPKRVPLRVAALEHSLLGAKHYERERAPAARLRNGVAVLAAPLVHVSGLFRVLQCVCDGRSFALMERFRLEPWLELVKRHAPQTVSLVPAALRMVLAADFDPADLRSLKAVVCGTAALEPETALAFEEMYGVPVLTTYGATEFAGGVAGWTLRDHTEWGGAKRGSVGRAHPGCELRVVDPESGHPVEPNAQGLLEVRSAQLADGAKWVRTTDLARIDPEGFLWILGRSDDAIVRGGFKVLPGEVASVLERHPSVREASVVALPDARLGAVPAAAVELVPGATVTVEELLSFVRDHLATYQVPAQVRIVEALPRTPSLKVSRPAVRELFRSES